VLLMSGLQIFNAHPALYFGKQSHFDHPILSVTAQERNAHLVGVTNLAGTSFTTTGILGVSKVAGADTPRAFPSWATLPSGQDLAAARRWHFLFAWLFVLNGLTYLVHGLTSGHVRQDLLPSWPALRRIGQCLLNHIRLRFPRGEEARRYNVVQQLTYLAVVFLLLPLVVVAGLTMSPALDALFHPLASLFGGRQSARTVHFIGATFIVLFVIVHVVMVILSGVYNNLCAMITGRFRLGTES
jgi:thiosulfate reductase cytochrome b subunit